MMARIFYVALLALALAVPAQAQFTTVGAGGKGGAAGPNACASLGNQLDWSDTTGCNLVWAGH